MFQTLLVANRGEIARQIIRVARARTLRTIAVYSEVDQELPFVREADRSVLIGKGQARDSYLDIEKLLDAARRTGAEAIHPGYGFLSESAEFARACHEAKIVFIGPPVETMERIRNKAVARALVRAAGVPVIPGSEVLANEVAALAAAEQVGYPVLLKAAHGGGGIGMRSAENPAELTRLFARTSEQAKAAFGEGGLYLERHFENPRHIEVQILGDRGGRLIHLHERECSLQRRHQKVVEEAPSPLFLNGENQALAKGLYEAALRVARTLGYANAGTVEFLYAEGKFHFIEVNARLQVEHVVTETTTGVDLIDWQLKLAAGEPLTLAQSDVRRGGHAIEFRIYAEDPVTFLPSPGRITSFLPPEGPGIRVDAGYEIGSTVTHFYDPLIAKLIVSGVDRGETIERARKAIARFELGGLKTNLPLHARILENRDFLEGRLDTGLLARL